MYTHYTSVSYLLFANIHAVVGIAPRAMGQVSFVLFANLCLFLYADRQPSFLVGYRFSHSPIVDLNFGSSKASSFHSLRCLKTS